MITPQKPENTTLYSQAFAKSIPGFRPMPPVMKERLLRWNRFRAARSIPTPLRVKGEKMIHATWISAELPFGLPPR
jgi:hypothetical protein